MINQNYNIYKEDDQTIRIEYAIGKIERSYLIHIAITVDRYKEFTGQMSGGDKKKVSSFYSLYDQKQLGKAKNLDELKAMYPNIEDGNLYVLKSGTDTKGKERCADGRKPRAVFQRHDDSPAGRRPTRRGSTLQ